MVGLEQFGRDKARGELWGKGAGCNLTHPSSQNGTPVRIHRIRTIIDIIDITKITDDPDQYYFIFRLKHN